MFLNCSLLWYLVIIQIKQKWQVNLPYGKLKIIVFYFIEFLFKMLLHVRKGSLNNDTDNEAQVMINLLDANIS